MDESSQSFLSELIKSKPKLISLAVVGFFVCAAVGVSFNRRTVPSADTITPDSHSAVVNYCVNGDSSAVCNPSAGKYSGTASSNPLPLTFESGPMSPPPHSPVLEITDVGVTTRQSSADFTWNTSWPASGYIMYGRAENDLTKSSKAVKSGISHTVSISDLDSNTTYYYEIKVTTDEGQAASKKGNFITR